MQLPTSPISSLISRLHRCKAPVRVLACSPAQLGLGGTPAANPGDVVPELEQSVARRLYLAPHTTAHKRRRTGAAGAAAAAAAAGGGNAPLSSGGNNPPPGAAGSLPKGHWPPPLEHWLQSHGGTVNGIELRKVLFPSGAVDRQLVATADHPAGALLISVPRSLQIRYDNVEQAATAAASAGVAALYDIPAADADALTALYGLMPIGSDTGAAAWPFKQALTLLYHLARGPSSPLLPYLAHLPGLAPGVPTPRVAALMYDDAVDELQYGLVVQDVRNQKYWLRHVSEQVLGRLLGAKSTPGTRTTAASVSGSDSESPSSSSPSSSGVAEAAADGGAEVEAEAAASAFGGLTVDAELFGWAVAVAMSRCFGLTRFRTHTCVPLVDMANHVAPYSASNCEIRTGPEGQVEMVAKHPIRAGEELTLTYGTHDNHNLLLSYGFTLQPNPNDAYYFDLDLETVESLAEDVGGSGGSGLASWQLQLLRSKLGLCRLQAEGGAAEGAVAGGGSGGSNSSSSIIRVYFSATTASSAGPAAAATAAEGDVEEQGEDAAEAAAAGGAAEAASGEAGPAAVATAEARVVVRQSVDPRLLAALRIATLQDETWYRILSPQSAEQIGAWGNLLARQQEISIMRLLAALVTAIYTTFPTTIQQDRQLLASASIDVAASAAAVTLTTPAAAKPAPDAGSGASSSVSAVSGQGPSGGDWVLRPTDMMTGCGADVGAGSGDGDGDASAGAVAAHARDMAAAVRFRLGLKATLEGCLQALVGRAKELDALQKVR